MKSESAVSKMSWSSRYEDMVLGNEGEIIDENISAISPFLSLPSSKLVGIRAFSDSAATYGLYRWRGSLEYGRPVVLFQDYNNLWAPLYNLYWSSSSQQLVSKHPLSCIEEGLSAYCPQCLCRYTEDEATTLLNRCKFCVICPQCSCILYLSKETGGSCSLYCNNCLWKPSKELQLIAKDKAEMSALILEKENSMQISTDYDLIIKRLKTITDGTLCKNGHGSTTSTDIEARRNSKWTLQDLETSLQNKFNVAADLGKDVNADDITNTQNLFNAVEFQPPVNEKMFTSLSYRDERIEPCILLAAASPLRVRLLSKRTVRCRKDVDEGHLSILVQPKLFPLEGDSSQKVSKGKWWVKDSSAIHEIPSIYIIRLPSTSFNRINLRIENLKEVACNLTFSPRCCTDSTHTCNVFESPNLPLDPSVFSNVDIPAASAPPTIRLEAWQDELLRDGATTAALSGTIAPASEGPEHTAELIRAFDGFNKLDFINSGKSEFIVFDSTCKVSIPLLRLEKNAFYQIKLQVKVEDVTEIITTKLINLVIAFTVT